MVPWVVYNKLKLSYFEWSKPYFKRHLYFTFCVFYIFWPFFLFFSIGADSIIGKWALCQISCKYFPPVWLLTLPSVFCHAKILDNYGIKFIHSLFFFDSGFSAAVWKAFFILRLKKTTPNQNLPWFILLLLGLIYFFIAIFDPFGI